MSASVPSILDRKLRLNINEVFGPTIQGEGPHAGERATFVRLAGCNLACSWCDTPYSWDWKRYDHAEESHPTAVADLALEIQIRGTKLVVVTGGEPMLQQRALLDLIGALPDKRFEIETNGTRSPSVVESVVNLFVVSPKLANSGDRLQDRIHVEVIDEFRVLADQDRAVFKFVMTTPSDLVEIDTLARLCAIDPHAVYVMPEGATRDEHLEHLERFADPIIEAGYNLTTRMHVLAWDSERAR